MENLKWCHHMSNVWNRWVDWFSPPNDISLKWMYLFYLIDHSILNKNHTKYATIRRIQIRLSIWDQTKSYRFARYHKIIRVVFGFILTFCRYFWSIFVWTEVLFCHTIKLNLDRITLISPVFFIVIDRK